MAFTIGNAIALPLKVDPGNKFTGIHSLKMGQIGMKIASFEFTLAKTLHRKITVSQLQQLGNSLFCMGSTDVSFFLFSSKG
jgi:hypothetical protein